MKKQHLLLLILMLLNIRIYSQNREVAGTYYLKGVMETASGFKLNPDSTFDFFYSYGALDRMGSGTWSLNGDRVILNSVKKHDKNFRLTNSGTKNNKDLTIRFDDANENILQYLHVMVKRGDQFEEKTCDKDGLVHFEKKPIDSISLMFAFFPEKKDVFVPQNGSYNYFEFSMEPWISEVIFDHQSYRISSEGLNGKHPLLADKEYIFERPE